jgi:acetyl esterase/lipase
MTRLLAASLLALVAGCSPLQTFNRLVPKDGSVSLVVGDQPFRAGPRGRLDLYAPRAGRPGARLPVIMFFYGGSWSSGAKEGYAFVGRALAAQGFLVAIADYRLVPQVRYPIFLEDSAAAVRWVRANAGRFGGDGERIVLAGHSAGAYNAAMLALDERWLGADRVAIRGFAGLAGPYSFLPLDIPATRAAFEQATDLNATQPVTHAGRGDPPSLLLVAERDSLVHPRNAQQLAAALTKGGVAVETRTYPKVGHIGIVTAFAKPFRGRAPVVRDLAGFARRVTETTSTAP